MAHRSSAILSHCTASSGTVRPAATMALKAGKAGKAPMTVLVTGGAGQIAYSIVFSIGAGLMLGPDQPVHLRLLDIPGQESKLTGVAMELNDCAFPILLSVTSTTSYEEAFRQVDVALLIGARPRGPGMERRDLLQANAAIFKGQGEAINRYAKKTIKVVVVGNPANTNALITSRNAPSIPVEQITAMTRLDQNRAVAALCTRLNVPVSSISNVIIWGNHSATQFPDVQQAVLRSPRNVVVPVRTAINDDAWLKGTFTKSVQNRGAEIIKSRGSSSAASAAAACVQHVRDWVLGSNGRIVSMGILCDANPYGVPKGLCYSFPVITQPGGAYQIVQGLQLDKYSRDQISRNTIELQDEAANAGL